MGGRQTDIDLAPREPATGQKAFVQVKSRATQAVLDDYIARFEGAGVHERMFFICHSPRGRLSAGEQTNVHVWTRDTLAHQSLAAGPFDWLIEKST